MQADIDIPTHALSAVSPDQDVYEVGLQLSATLTSMRTAFAGDCDSALVYLVALLDSLDPRGSGLGVSASSISDITHIPRETVRRKLVNMGLAGHVEQLSSGQYVAVDSYEQLDTINSLRSLGSARRIREPMSWAPTAMVSKR